MGSAEKGFQLDVRSVQIMRQNASLCHGDLVLRTLRAIWFRKCAPSHHPTHPSSILTKEPCKKPSEGLDGMRNSNHREPLAPISMQYSPLGAMLHLMPIKSPNASPAEAAHAWEHQYALMVTSPDPWRVIAV